MDVEYPYADGLSRRQLLYRLPSTPEPRRLLLVSDDGQSDLIGGGWGGPVTVVTRATLGAKVGRDAAQFDAVAMPWISASGDSTALLRSATHFLVPGGVVVGHLENLRTVRRLASMRGLTAFAGAVRDRRLIGSPRACRNTLLAAGFIDPECYFVQPSIEAPMGLIPCAPVPARAHFLRAIRTMRGSYGRSAYAIRLLAAFVGLGGMQQPELFFWAKKPC